KSTGPSARFGQAVWGLDYLDSIKSNVLFISDELGSNDVVNGVDGAKNAKIKPILDPSIASSIDKKIDDGNPDTGSVIAIGRDQYVCKDANGYVSNGNDNKCGVIIKL
ncbi:MAG: hypothetical protein LBG48_06060, partial [Rickettsiales bacterium]|nr:hypothetical protein [Rickettsiales bacterium]